MKILYFDCFSGISGDMVIGAFLDAGLPFDELKGALGSLGLTGVDLSASRVLRAGVSATKFSVHEHPTASVPEHPTASAPEHPAALVPEHSSGAAPKHHAHRHLKGIYNLIDQSALSTAGRDRAKQMFERLAKAEAEIHQMPIEKVHLHEVGAIDSIVDLVGAVFALEWAGADRIVCSPLNVGSGTVESAHGLFPVPAPATLKLLGDAPVYGGTIQKEMVTPTGALIATSYAESFGQMPPMSIERIGYGAGDRDNPGTPNVLRLIMGHAADDVVRLKPDTTSGVVSASGVVSGFSRTGDRVSVIECEIDDMNPQLFGVVMDRLYAAGALEVFYIPVQMKKNRPGTLLTVIAPPDLRPRMTDVVFRETTTIGVRHYDVERECLDREIVQVETPVGAVRFKIASRDGRVVNAVPEFEDCAALAVANNLSVKEVQAIATQAYWSARAIPGRHS